MANIYEEMGRNRRGTVVIIAAFILLFLFLGLGIDYYYIGGIRRPVFSIAALLVAGISSFGGFWFGDRMVLASTRARTLDRSNPLENQWQNVVEEMSIASGIPVPRTYVIDDPDPNAFATGRDPKHASIAVTRGLLDSLNREELQAVAAHEMSHIRNFDIRLMLIVAVLVGSVALVSDWAGRGMFRSSGRGGRDSRKSEGGLGPVVLVIWIAAVILAPILSQMMAMLVSRKREYLADASGAELTRNPLALASALGKISSRVEPTRSINRGTAHLCIADPKGSAINSKEGRLADLFATHPPINKRIAALKDMAYVIGSDKAR